MSARRSSASKARPASRPSAPSATLSRASAPGWARGSSRSSAPTRRWWPSCPTSASSWPPRSVPTGVSRVYGQQSDIAAIDGVDQRVDADVAIVDTGIALHPDLNVVGGIDCSTSDPTAWRDRQAHGTHVAGIVGALDNGIGVVGIAPGVRLWAVKILNDSGFGYISWYVCGLDWILAQRDPDDPSRPLIEAVNMSVGKPGAATTATAATRSTIGLHRAVCRVVAGGITIAVAAMNDSGRSRKRSRPPTTRSSRSAPWPTPTACPAVSAARPATSWGSYDSDDTFANFSNYGADVDLIAPGKCIRSTLPGGYGLMSGTSMATPLVTGAIALYRSTHPDATPSRGAHGPARPRQPGLEDRHRPRQQARAAARRPPHRRPGRLRRRPAGRHARARRVRWPHPDHHLAHAGGVRAGRLQRQRPARRRQRHGHAEHLGRLRRHGRHAQGQPAGRPSPTAPST